METLNLVPLLANEYSTEEWGKQSESLNRKINTFVRENSEPKGLAIELLALTKPIQQYVKGNTEIDQGEIIKRLVKLIAQPGLNEYFAKR